MIDSVSYFDLGCFPLKFLKSLSLFSIYKKTNIYIKNNNNNKNNNKNKNFIIKNKNKNKNKPNEMKIKIKQKK